MKKSVNGGSGGMYKVAAANISNFAGFNRKCLGTYPTDPVNLVLSPWAMCILCYSGLVALVQSDLIQKTQVQCKPLLDLDALLSVYDQICCK